MQSPPPGSIKISVINASADELEAKLREWYSQHGRARIMGTSQSSASHEGKVLVTLTMFYGE
jgi:hypothetical protein